MNMERQSRWGEEFFITSDYGESMQNDILNGVYNEDEPKILAEMILRNVNPDAEMKTDKKHHFKFSKTPSLKILAFEKVTKLGGAEMIKNKIREKFTHAILPSIKRKRDEIIMEKAEIRNSPITGFTSVINKSFTNNEKQIRNSLGRRNTLTSSHSLRTKASIQSSKGRLTLPIDTEEGRTCKVEEHKTETTKTTVVTNETRINNEVITLVTEVVRTNNVTEKITETTMIVKHQDRKENTEKAFEQKHEEESDKETADSSDEDEAPRTEEDSADAPVPER